MALAYPANDDPLATTWVVDHLSAEGLLALWPASGSPLDLDGVRVVQLSRHELAIAFRGAPIA
ncbi:MAG TPA: hypothetical protein VGQ62_24965 [Chloroflexota bacterium]|nr:hypothetical protein [Chloroflexota bacterium]